MKPDEKKQDLLLDALSCIDDDILARGLSLREAEAEKAKPNPADYLYDPAVPRGRPSPRRGLRAAVLAAAILAPLAVIPLSLWMAARRMESPVSAETTAGDSDHRYDAPSDSKDIALNTEAQAGVTSPEDVGGGPNASGDPAETAVDGTLPQETQEFPIEPYEPQPLAWTTQSATNERVEKRASVEILDFVAYSGDFVMEYGYTASVRTFSGTSEETAAFLARQVSPEDELALDLFAQYYLSVYGIDYGTHFLLFQHEFVENAFTAHVEPHSYAMAIARIYALMESLVPYERVSLDITLTENTLLSEEERAAFLAQERAAFEEVGLDPHRITAVRRFAAEGRIVMDQQFYTEDWFHGNQLYCYEYDGTWYLMPSHMDDDMCIDYALSTIADGTDYLTYRTVTGVVTAIEGSCLYLDSDMVFIDHGQAWSYDGIQVGDAVTVYYYEFGLSVRRLQDPAAPEVCLFPYVSAVKSNAAP